MSTAMMWWSKTNWSWSIPRMTSKSTSRGINFDGRYAGPDSHAFHNPKATKRIVIVGQYSLAKRRMPSKGCEFTSSPSVHFAGHIRVVPLNANYWDDGWIKIRVDATQTIFEDKDMVDASSVDQEVYNKKGISRDLLNFPTNFAFQPLTFTLNRSKHLIINLRLIMTYEFKGPGVIWFTSGDVTQPFHVRMPQWPIHSTR